jgi:hypothetical protein
MEEQSTKLGFLMEAAESHQALAENALRQLAAHTQDLQGVVREEVRRVLADELQALTTETRGAMESLKQLRRSAAIRAGAWNFAIVVICLLVSVGTGWMVFPSQAELARLRSQRDELSRAIAVLERQGGRIELRQCGQPARLCVHVDRKASVYGQDGDYFVVKGY